MTDTPPLDEGAARTVGLLQGKVTAGGEDGRGDRAGMADEKLGGAPGDAEDRR
jgi:hypothetical protein